MATVVSARAEGCRRSTWVSCRRWWSPKSGATPGPVEPAGSGSIEIEFATGARMRITGTVDAPTVKALMKALADGAAAMIPVPSGRAGVAGDRPHRHAQRHDGWRLLVQETLQARSAWRAPVRVPRPARQLIKVLWHDGQGMCLFAKRLERGRFLWPSPADGVVTITPAQLGYLLEGIDWRMPQHTWRPQAAG